MTDEEFEVFVKRDYPSARRLGGGVVLFSAEDLARFKVDPNWVQEEGQADA